MVCTCSSFSLSRSVPERSAHRVSTWLSLHTTECAWRIGPMGCTGGADRTFASKSDECLWQDWYIYKILFKIIIERETDKHT